MSEKKKRNWLKILFIGLGIGFATLLATLIIIPIIYKQEIKELAIKEVNKMLLADVSVGDDFNLTILSTFPRLTAQLNDIKITGRNRFANVELASIEQFGIQINFWSLFSDKYEVNGFILKKPTIDIRVLQDGTANYDIVKPDSVKKEEESQPFVLSLKRYAIEGGNIKYDDKSSNLFAEIRNLNHTGSGNLMADVIDFNTETTMDQLTFKMDGLTYLSKVKTNLIANLLMEFKEDSSKFTLKKNQLSLNSFTTSIDGFYELLKDKSQMDLTLNTSEVTFKDLLSLIPTFYKTGFEKMVTNGSMQLNAKAKGTLDAKNYPAWNVALKVANASIHYPDLPEQIKNIQIDVKSDFPGGSDLNRMTATVNKLHLEFAQNVIDAYANLKNMMTQPFVDGKINAKVDLATLSKVLPMEEGEKYSGKLKVDAKVKGLLDTKNYPAWNVDANLTNGLVQYPGMPEKLENIQLIAHSQFKGGKDLDQMTLDVEKLHVNFLQNSIDAFLKLRNPMTKQTIDSRVKAQVDLATLSKVIPMAEGEKYQGLMNADVILKGNVSDVQSGRYNQFHADGNLSLKKMVYVTPSLSKPVKVNDMLFKFTPKNLNLARLVGTVGKSDFTMNGTIDNYLAYWFNQEKLRGTFNFNSKQLDVDELMGFVPASSSATTAAEPTTTMETPILIPENIDFNLHTNIANVRYSGVDMKNVNGNVGVRNQTVYLNNLTTQTMGGSVGLNGSYSTHNPSKPSVNIGYDLKQIDIHSLVTHFVSVGKFAPILKLVQGRISSQLSLSSLVQPDFSPILSSVQSLGNLATASVTIDKLPIVGDIGKTLKISELSSIKNLKDITANFKIEDGKMYLSKPMNFKLGKIGTELSGYTGLDQSIGYQMKMNVPKEQIPQALIKTIEKGMEKINGIVPQLNLNNLPDFIPVNVQIGGTVQKPKITTDIEQSVRKVAGNIKSQVKETITEKATQVKDSVKTVVTNKVDETKEEVKAKASAEIEKQKQQILNAAQKQADNVKKQGKNAADKVRTEADKAAQKLIDEAGSNFLKKKAAEVAGKKLKEEAEKKAQKIEEEANRNADSIMDKAREKANKIK